MIFKKWHIALLVVGIAAVSMILWRHHTKQQRQHALLQTIDRLQFAGVEPQVVQKIQRLAAQVRESPRSSAAWGKLAMNLDVHDFKTESLPIYKEASQLDPSNFRWPYFSAMVLLESNAPSALDLFSRAAQANPEYAPMYVNWGIALTRSGKPQEAAEKYNEALKQDSRNSHALVALAELALAKQDLPTARAHLSKAIESNPAHRNAYELLITVCKQQKDAACAERARAFADRMPENTPLPDSIYAELTLEGESSRWYRFRGREFLKNGMHEKAIAEFQRALQLDPDPSTKEDLAKSLSAAGKYSEALNAYQSVIKERPVAENFFGLALAHARLGSYPEAETLFRKAIEQKPDFAEAYFNLAVLHAKRGNLQETMRNLKEAIRIKPGYAEAHYHLGLTYLAAGEKELALQEHAVLTQIQPALAERLQNSIKTETSRSTE